MLPDAQFSLSMPWRLAALFLALVLYGLFGSPTPDHPGLIEGVIAGLLLVSIPLKLPRFNTVPLWYVVGAVTGLWLFTVPLAKGVMDGAGIGSILRDLVAAGFLFMPLLFYPWLRDQYNANHARMVVMGGLCVIGIAFSLRSFAQAGGFHAPVNTDYLANSPEVLFTALFFSGLLFYAMRISFSLKNIALGLVLMLLVAMPFMAMASMLQRASLGLMAIVLLFWSVQTLWQRPRLLLFLAVLSLPVLTLSWPYLHGLVEDLMEKTSKVGLNNRREELRAVMALIDPGSFDAVIGQGWGASFENPAVGGGRVNYTHSLLSSLFMKSGIVGAGLFLAYLGAMVWQAARMTSAREVKIVLSCIIPPLLIGLLLYANYKSLGYGLILLALIYLDRWPENDAYKGRVKDMECY